MAARSETCALFKRRYSSKEKIIRIDHTRFNFHDLLSVIMLSAILSLQVVSRKVVDFRLIFRV